MLRYKRRKGDTEKGIHWKGVGFFGRLHPTLGGKVRFADASRGTPFRTALRELRIDVDGLGTER